MRVIRLKGHSGCKVELIGDRVRKTSKSESYNPRLEAQILKQREFSSNKLRTPEILETGYDDSNLFFAEMEYIAGHKGSEFLTFASPDQISWFFSSIGDFIDDNLTEVPIDARDTVINKCSEIEGFPMGEISSFNWDIDCGYCHGDFTLENMIVFNSEIYLVDFLDSYFESPLIDASKLLQDGFFGWSYRHYSPVPIHSMVALVEKYSSPITDFLTLINLYRIIPYSDDGTKKIVWGWINWLKPKINPH